MIDEIELSQQLGQGTGTAVPIGSKYLEPYLHTVSGTELTQLQKKQWGGKLRETKELIVKLEQNISRRLDVIEKVCMGSKSLRKSQLRIDSFSWNLAGTAESKTLGHICSFSHQHSTAHKPSPATKRKTFRRCTLMG